MGCERGPSHYDGRLTQSQTTWIHTMNIRFALLPLALMAGVTFLPACGKKAEDIKDTVENFTADGATKAIGSSPRAWLHR